MTDEIKINPAEKITELKKERDVINKKEQELRKTLNQLTTHKIQIEGQIRMMEGFLSTKPPTGGKTSPNPSEKK